MKANFGCYRRGLIVNSKSDEIIRDNKRNEKKVLRKKRVRVSTFCISRQWARTSEEFSFFRSLLSEP